MDSREARLGEPHVRPLMDLVRDLRSRGFCTPNVDPDDGGVNARALFLLETPGPRAVGSGFVSRKNPDPSAENMGRALDDAGFARSDVLIWNVVPYCLSTPNKNLNATVAQIHNAIPDTQAFVDILPNLNVVVFCGRRSQKAMDLLHFPSTVKVLKTYHPGRRAYGRLAYRSDIHATFKEAHRIISSVEVH